MSDAAHTGTPKWVMSEWTEGDRWYDVHTAEGELAFKRATFSEDDVAPTDEVARYIVACVNGYAALQAERDRLAEAATKWPRCCDQHQDSLGGMHCLACAQKTFAMMREIQEILGVDKSCKPKTINCPACEGTGKGGNEDGYCNACSGEGFIEAAPPCPPDTRGENGNDGG